MTASRFVGRFWWVPLLALVGATGWNLRSRVANRPHAVRSTADNRSTAAGRGALPGVLSQPRRIEPTEDFRADVDRRRLALILDRARPLSGKPDLLSVATATHALRLWGPNADFPSGPYVPDGFSFSLGQFSSRDMLAVLLDGDAFQRMFPHGRPLLSWTSYGIMPRGHISTFAERPIKSWPDCEVHVDKITSVLGEIGVPSDRPVRAEGRDGTVADLLTDSMARFTLQQELDFSGKAYLYYLELPASWNNRFGQPASVTTILRALADRPLGQGACAGVHVWHVLSLALRIDRQQPFLEAELRELLIARVKQVSRLLEELQEPGGAWPSDWWNGGQPLPLVAVDGDLITRLRVAGHHLEWIAIAPADLRPRDDCVRLAIRNLEHTMAELPAEDYYTHYPLVSHAARALVLFSGRDPFELLNTIEDTK